MPTNDEKEFYLMLCGWTKEYYNFICPFNNHCFMFVWNAYGYQKEVIENYSDELSEKWLNKLRDTSTFEEYRKKYLLTP